MFQRISFSSFLHALLSGSGFHSSHKEYGQNLAKGPYMKPLIGYIIYSELAVLPYAVNLPHTDILIPFLFNFQEILRCEP